MKSAEIYVDGCLAGYLEEIEIGKKYLIRYLADYSALPISLTLPVSKMPSEFESFPAFFEGLLPEGIQLEALLKNNKIDRYDLFSQIVAVGHDLVGNVEVRQVL
ncbi:MAG: HipA N-terminal domain-containing protein [Myxococcaceae bacterium]